MPAAFITLSVTHPTILYFFVLLPASFTLPPLLSSLFASHPTLFICLFISSKHSHFINRSLFYFPHSAVYSTVSPAPHCSHCTRIVFVALLNLQNESTYKILSDGYPHLLFCPPASYLRNPLHTRKVWSLGTPKHFCKKSSNIDGKFVCKPLDECLQINGWLYWNTYIAYCLYGFWFCMYDADKLSWFFKSLWIVFCFTLSSAENNCSVERFDRLFTTYVRSAVPAYVYDKTFFPVCTIRSGCLDSKQHVHSTLLYDYDK